MKKNYEDDCNMMIQMIAETEQKTLSVLSGIDPEKVVYNDDPIWRVRDIVGHIGVWNGEAAKSIRAHTEGCEYHCIESEASYDEYNGIAVNERCSWNIDQVWDEYKESYVQLELSVKHMPVKKWDREMLYPWNERGTLRNLIEIMMIHEVEHRDKIRAG